MTNPTSQPPRSQGLTSLAEVRIGTFSIPSRAGRRHLLAGIRLLYMPVRAVGWLIVYTHFASAVPRATDLGCNLVTQQMHLFETFDRSERTPAPVAPHNASAGSMAGAAAVARKMTAREQFALQVIREAGAFGMTNHEIIQAACASGDYWAPSSTAAMTNLHKAGKIRKGNIFRKTPYSGDSKGAEAWIAVEVYVHG